MINPYIELAIGCFLLSLTVSYAVWCRFRIAIIRQDLFEVRGDLWEAAFENGCLDDEAYQNTRESLNVMIQCSPNLSLPALIFAIMNFDARTLDRVRPSDNPQMQKAIDEATKRSSEAILRYVINCRPLSGWLWRMTNMRATSIRDSVSKWFQGGGPANFASSPC